MILQRYPAVVIRIYTLLPIQANRPKDIQRLIGFIPVAEALEVQVCFIESIEVTRLTSPRPATPKPKDVEGSRLERIQCVVVKVKSVKG